MPKSSSTIRNADAFLSPDQFRPPIHPATAAMIFYSRMDGLEDAVADEEDQLNRKERRHFRRNKQEVPSLLNLNLYF